MIATRPSRRAIAARNVSRRSMRAGTTFYDNTLDAFNVQLWANTSLAILYENMVMAKLVNRDFEDTIAQFGDTVNTRRPREFKAIRKTNADAVTIQNAAADNIPVKLNQFWHVTYLIKDGEESIAFKSIIDEFLRPAMIAEARAIDHVLSSQVYQFLPNSAGRLLNVDETNAKDVILDARAVMNLNKAWTNNRNMVLTPVTETAFLRAEEFTDAYRVGDEGTALREASLGRKLGWDMLLAQNQPYVKPLLVGTGGGTVAVGAINNANGYPIGTTTFTVSGLTAAITPGTWITIAGDDTPLQVVSTVGGSTPTSIVTLQGLKRAVVNTAVVTVYNTATISGSYVIDPVTNNGYSKEITITGVTTAPQVGQMVTFGTDTTHIYAIIDVDGTIGITLDRPIEASLSNGATVNFGPAGSYNFGFHPNALTMVTRPLALPRLLTGALAGKAVWDGIAVRVVITYDGHAQGHMVTIDILMGVKVLEPALGVVLYA